MNTGLLMPGDAVGLLAKGLSRSWAERVCAEVNGLSQEPLRIRLRPGISGSADVERAGLAAWTAWRIAWGDARLAGLPLERRAIRVSGVASEQPIALSVDTLEDGIGALELLDGSALEVDVDRARTIGARLRDAGAELTPAALKDACRLTAADVDVAVEAISWLREHLDLGGWTTRQLPVPSMHTKWLASHVGLVGRLTGRNVLSETRPRPAVVHLTYVDPGYLASGARRHDAWTSGDAHDLEYLPRTVVVVENRDCRLEFPPLADAVVVEGAGRAAAASLRDIDWLLRADRIVYWGDIDADGFAILDELRATLAARDACVESVLMDEVSLARYRHLGVNRDRRGELLKPSTRRLTHLTAGERSAYAHVATAGAVDFRRIEQERIPLGDALAAILS